MQRNEDVTDIEACLRGEKSAWDAFIARYSPVIRAVVAAVFRAQSRGREADIDDAVQDVFVRLLANDSRLLRSYDPRRAALPTWLTLVTRSAALDALRRIRPAESLDAAPERIAAPSPATGDALDIPPDLLSSRQQLVMRLLFDEGLDVAEAAAFLRVDDQTVRSTKHKALERLREFFGVK